MKHDMAGGAAVLGAAEALAQIQPEGVEVRVWQRLFPFPNSESGKSGILSLQSSRVRKAQFKSGDQHCGKPNGVLRAACCFPRRCPLTCPHYCRLCCKEHPV